MHILVGITYYYPNISGLSIYAQELAEAMVKKGHQVTVLTSCYQKQLAKTEFINGVKIIRSPVFCKIGKGVLMPLLPKNILSIIKNVQVVNCHLPQFESFIFAILSKLFRKKLVLTHHTDLSGWPGIINQLSEGAVWAGQLVAGWLADTIIPYTKDYSENSWYLKLFKKKLCYIYPPIKTAKSNNKLIDQWCRDLQHPKYIIGFSGRIARQKGIPYLLAAIPYLKNRLKSFKLVFAGPYQEVIGEKYYDLIKNKLRKHQASIKFFGSLSQKELSSFYHMCDVLVLPSHDRLESFGLVQIEAMLNGCPIVATNLPGVRIPIKLTKMGELVESKKPKMLAQKIIKVLKNKKKYQIKPEIIKKIFNYQKTISYYEKIFNAN